MKDVLAHKTAAFRCCAECACTAFELPLREELSKLATFPYHGVLGQCTNPPKVSKRIRLTPILRLHIAIRAIRAVIAKEIQLRKTTPVMRRKATFHPVAGLFAVIVGQDTTGRKKKGRGPRVGRIRF